MKYDPAKFFLSLLTERTTGSTAARQSYVEHMTNAAATIATPDGSGVGVGNPPLWHPGDAGASVAASGDRGVPGVVLGSELAVGVTAEVGTVDASLAPEQPIRTSASSATRVSTFDIAASVVTRLRV